jgi:hypothetical protein
MNPRLLLPGVAAPLAAGCTGRQALPALPEVDERYAIVFWILLGIGALVTRFAHRMDDDVGFSFSFGVRRLERFFAFVDRAWTWFYRIVGVLIMLIAAAVLASIYLF